MQIYWEHIFKTTYLQGMAMQHIDLFENIHWLRTYFEDYIFARHGYATYRLGWEHIFKTTIQVSHLCTQTTLCFGHSSLLFVYPNNVMLYHRLSICYVPLSEIIFEYQRACPYSMYKIKNIWLLVDLWHKFFKHHNLICHHFFIYIYILNLILFYI